MATDRHAELAGGWCAPTSGDRHRYSGTTALSDSLAIVRFAVGGGEVRAVSPPDTLGDAPWWHVASLAPDGEVTVVQFGRGAPP